MQTINYNRLFDAGENTAQARSVAAQKLFPIEETYRDPDIIQYRARDGSARHQHEIVRISRDAILLSTDCHETAEFHGRYTVADGDWIHLQFRLHGGGSEACAESRRIETPPKACVMARYAKDAVIERSMVKSDRWRFVCLHARPQGLMDLLDMPSARLPETMSWLGSQRRLASRIDVLPLDSAMALAVNDIQSCSLKGIGRRTYMRAKSIELVSAVLSSLDAADEDESRSNERLSAGDLTKIALARAIAREGMESDWTLSDLAAEVGLNRSKLAFGFKQVYGVSVRKYWRDANLDRAYRLLQEGKASVTDVALAMGYGSSYSFTRAFTQKFGVLPRDCKK